jgi:triosephosphate isomerase
MRKPIIAGNWKMNIGKADQAIAFFRQIRSPLNEIETIEVVLCPPFTVLVPMSEVLAPTRIELGAQNMHWEESGAHTGEISPEMLVDLCKYVILGHSERRASQAETDDRVNQKVHAAFQHNLTPIICVGENLQQREAGETEAFVSTQVTRALEGLSSQHVSQTVIAYEPIWAIGTGVAAQPADVNRVIGLTIRGTIQKHFNEQAAQSVRIQYGGSVNPKNIIDFMAMPEIDGALVGGASIKVDFVELVRKAATL